MANSNVVRLVTRRGLPYLSYSILDMYRADEKELHGAAWRLHNMHGIYLMGQLVQLPRDEAVTMDGMSEKTVVAFETQLARLGLAFGMAAPRWWDPGRLLVVCR